MKFWIIFLVLIFSWQISAAVIVEYNGSLASETIEIVSLQEMNYFNVFELDKTFRALISEDILDRRLYVNIYQKQLVFLIDSSYLLFENEIYHLPGDIVQKDGKYFIPENFLLTVLPDIIPEIKLDRKKLVAETPVDNRIKKIVIDPGHGGKDPGAIGKSRKNFEKNIVLQISKTLKNKLENELDVEVLLTREEDIFVSLQERTKFANANDADIFLSIHCNAHRNSLVNGIEVFYLSAAKTDDARAVEALENQVVYEYEGGEEAVKKYNDLDFILADMAQNEHLEESYQISEKLQNHLISNTKSNDRGVKQANFFVLRGAFMPAVLLELGFITHKKEEQLLVTKEYQEKLVTSICKAIKEFKNKYDRMQ